GGRAAPNGPAARGDRAARNGRTRNGSAARGDRAARNGRTRNGPAARDGRAARNGLSARDRPALRSSRPPLRSAPRGKACARRAANVNETIGQSRRPGQSGRSGQYRTHRHERTGPVSMDETLRMLKELTDAPGVPGFEREARLVMERYLEPLADEVSRDRLGSVIGRKRGTADEPRIMLAGHLDEVGFMVSLITDQGFIRFQPLGGWWDQVLLAQRVVIKTHKGDVVGVIGSKPPHVLSAEERKKVVEKKDMFIDIGASSKEEAMEMGVRLGDPIIPVSDFTVMNNEKYLMAKAWDNRVGCALAIEVLKRLQGQ